MTTKTTRLKVIYSIMMALFASLCLITVILTWYKADKSCRWALFIPVILGYIAAIFVYRNRKPII